MKAILFALALLPVVSYATSDEYYDLLGTGTKDWRFAFRGTAGAGQSMYAAYKDGTGIPYTVDDNCKIANWTLPCNSHWRNHDALNNWNNVAEVILGIVDEDVLVKILRFDASKSTYLDWMKKDWLLEDCWEDLKHVDPNQIGYYFSIEGHDAIHRHFFINRNYGGCPIDAGWLGVIDTGSPNCDWERHSTWPYITYMAGQTYETWSAQTHRSAQALVVFIKYKPQKGNENEYYDLFKTGNKEWRFAFRGTAKINVPVYPAYIDGSGIGSNIEPACKTIDWKSRCTSHWRNNDALDKWEGVTEVLLALIHKGEMIKTLFFTGKDTTYTSWMGPQYYKKSCWSDIKLGTHNFFSIAGDAGSQRRFFINHKYGGCDNDAGWVVAQDNSPKKCSWEMYYSYPVFKFAASPSQENWTWGQVLEADALVIFLKY